MLPIVVELLAESTQRRKHPRNMTYWHTIEIAGKSADLWEPTEAPVGAVLFLHGHGQRTLKGNQVFTPLFEQYRLAAVCPHGQRSWWLDRICREFDEVVTPIEFLQNEVVPFMQNRWDVPIGLTGVSMGGQGALQLAYRQAREFPVVAAISPAIDFHQLYGAGIPLDDMFADAEEVRQASVVLQIHPLNWPRHQFIVCDPTDSDWYEGADRLVMKLASSGISVERDLETSHGGHSWEYFNHIAPRVIGFLAEHLAPS